MTWWRRWLARLAEAVSRRSFDMDLDDELAFHLETEAERLEREEGLSPREARRRARHSFNGLERCKEDVRDARGLPALTFLGRDLKYGFRELAGQPTFTIVAVLSLALGIGTNVAVFSVIDATLIRPYPYDPDNRLVIVQVDERRENGSLRSRSLWSPEHLVLNSLGDVFEDVEGSWVGSGAAVLVERDVGLAELLFTRTSVGYFELTGGAPILGRGFHPDEMRPGAAEVAVLTYHAWQTHFGADPAVIGQTLWMFMDRNSRERVPATIVGVLPEGVGAGSTWFGRGRGADVVLPFRDYAPNGFVFSVARLAPGVTPEEATAAIEAVIPPPDASTPRNSNTRLGVNVMSFRENGTASMRPALRLFFGVVTAVLLIAGANVVALTLSRAIARRREVATRLALGASRWRIAQLFLAEGALLALAGGASGTVLAYAGIRLIRSLNNVANPYVLQLFPRMTDAGVDGRVLAYTLVVSLGAAVLCSVGPALSGVRFAPGRVLQDARRGVTPGRFRVDRVLVVGQVALALVLLTGAGLVARSMANLLAVDPGFEMDRLLTVRVTRFDDVHPPASPGDEVSTRDLFAFHAELVERVGRVPGVASAAATNSPPLYHGRRLAWFLLGDRPALPGQPHGEAHLKSFVGDGFATLGIRVLRGRGFTADDMTPQSKPVAVISRNLAEAYWPEGNPIGQLLWFPDGNGQPLPGHWKHEIVGVVDDTRQWALQDEPYRYVYLPLSHFAPVSWNPGQTLLVRTQGPPQDLATAVRAVVADLAPGQVNVEEVYSMREWAASWTDGTRFASVLLLVFAGVGLGLALIGVYGLMAHDVTRRTPEIGVRMALGATRRQVMTLVVRLGLRLGLAGLACGVLGAWWLTRFLPAISFADMGGSILYDVEPRDVTTFVASAVLLLGAVLLACYAPTRRATRVDPMAVLQHE